VVVPRLVRRDSRSFTVEILDTLAPQPPGYKFLRY
jgi:hypothetical protein